MGMQRKPGVFSYNLELAMDQACYSTACVYYSTASNFLKCAHRVHRDVHGLNTRIMNYEVDRLDNLDVFVVTTQLAVLVYVSKQYLCNVLFYCKYTK